MSTFAETGLHQELRKETSRLMWLGAGLVVVGAVALVFPMVSTLVATLYVGWLMIISGVTTLAVAFSIRSVGPFFAALLFSLLSIAAGAFIVARPALGELAITIGLGALFMVQGAFEIALALAIRPARSWVWMLLSALASIALSIIILSGLPQLSLIVLGVLIGINFITSGAAYLLLGGAVKQDARA